MEETKIRFSDGKQNYQVTVKDKGTIFEIDFSTLSLEKNPDELNAEEKEKIILGLKEHLLKIDIKFTY